MKKIMKTIWRLCVSVMLLMGLATNASAALIYDNGGPSTQNGYSILNSNVTADDFSLTGTYDINSVGFYFQNYQGISGWNQDITYNFYNDNGGSLGSLIATGSGQNVTPTDSGLPWCCGGGNAWLVTFNLESTLSLSSGGYWLGLTGATGTSNAWWVTTSTGNGLINGSRITYDFAYYLDGELTSRSVPEPSSLALLALGFLGVKLARRI